MAGARVGGAELFFERLCAAQHRAGDSVLAVIRADQARAAPLRAAGLDTAELAFGGRLDLRTRPRLAALLRDFRPDLTMAWMNRAASLTPRGDWTLVGRLGGYYDLKYYRRCQHLVGNTNGIVAWLRRMGWPEARSHFLPNFVADLAAAAPATDLPPGRPLLLGLGRLHTDKGFDLLIRALPRLPQAILAIGGEGPERAALEALARREGVAGRVHFLGWRQDAGALLRAADVFVCSSRIEPLGNMVLEAFSAGCPVVAIAASGPRELIAQDRTGLLVPPEDPAALADAIAALLEEPSRARALAAAGRERFETCFAEAPVLAQWRDFLERLTR